MASSSRVETMSRLAPYPISIFTLLGMQHGNIGYLWYPLGICHQFNRCGVPFVRSFQRGWDFATVSVNRAEYVTRLFETMGKEATLRIQGSLVEQECCGVWGWLMAACVWDMRFIGGKDCGRLVFRKDSEMVRTIRFEILGDHDCALIILYISL